MNNQLIWTYEEKNNPTITELAAEMGTSLYRARKAKKEATAKGLIAKGQLTKLGKLIASNLNNQIVRDYLNDKLSTETITITTYQERKGRSTMNIPQLANQFNLTTSQLDVLLRKAESKGWLGIANCADLYHISFNTALSAGDILEEILNE